MTILKFLYCCLYFALTISQGLQEENTKTDSSAATNNGPGCPLFLTPLIQKGNIKEAQKKSAVTNLGTNVTSYSGFITVKDTPTYKSNMFFWFFPSESSEKTPIILWLQGGPGATSMFGLFNINGPFTYTNTSGLGLRYYRWTKTHSVLYIDNPVGVGYSFTTSDDGYARSEDDVAENLVEALKQFFQLFPEYKDNDFFVAGESYAGKYVPALGAAIAKSNKNKLNKSEEFNFKGVYIGNGFTDPENMMHYSEYLFQLGLLDDKGKAQFEMYEQEIVRKIQQQSYTEAFNLFDAMIDGDRFLYPTLFTNLTGFTAYFNLRYYKDPSVFGDFPTFIQLNKTREAIHVGNSVWHTLNLDKVEFYLLDDVMRSQRPSVELLLDQNYKVLIANGQLDIIVGYSLTREFLKALQWRDKDTYDNASRQFFIVDQKLAGYYKKAGSLLEVMVRDAGHVLPKDQPKWAFELITRFTHDKI
ncbi:venom serine carboxypeptidase-like [Lycorma delicatula]|uniref:venom serine carboxypeptidase-like n=1 Tax=Lycorma delicatula TaxID=130591 RepID=UPI003F50E627